MPEPRSLRLGSRTLANAVRGLGGSLPLALLGPILSHLLDVDEFAVWILVVQVASYVYYLEFGVQTAVSRTVAFRTADGGLEPAAGAMAAGVKLLVIVGAVGLVFVGGAVLVLPDVVDVPDQLVPEARVALALLGATAATMLPGSAIHGALVGAGRHWWSAVTILGARVSSVSLTAYGAWAGWPIEALAACLATGTIANGAGAFLAARAAGLPSPFRRADPSDVREIGSLTWTVGTWTIATLIISGIDVVVVGVVDYAMVPAYSLAAGLVIVGSAAYGVVSAVLIPAFADLAARSDRTAALRLLAQSAASSGAVLTIGVITALAIRAWLLDLWAGPYVADAMPVFVVLLITASIRLSMTPMVAFVTGFGLHRSARFPAILEACLNLTLSVTFGSIFGGIGVAVGSLVASIPAVVLFLGRIGPRAVGPARFARHVLPHHVAGIIVAAPFVAALLVVDDQVGRVAIGVAGVVTEIAVLRYSLSRLTSARAAGLPTQDGPESLGEPTA